MSDGSLAWYIRFLYKFTAKDQEISYGIGENFKLTEFCQHKKINDDGQMFKCGIQPILGEKNKFSLNLIYEDINLTNPDSKTEKEIQIELLNFPEFEEQDTYPVSDDAISVATSRNTSLFLYTFVIR